MSARKAKTMKTYEMRKKMAEVQMEQFERMVNEIDEMIVGLGVDAQQQRSFVDFTYTFLPGSKLAKQVTSYGQPHTNFAGFFQPDAAAITGNFASKADPEDDAGKHGADAQHDDHDAQAGREGHRRRRRHSR